MGKLPTYVFTILSLLLSIETAKAEIWDVNFPLTCQVYSACDLSGNCTSTSPTLATKFTFVKENNRYHFEVFDNAVKRVIQVGMFPFVVGINPTVRDVGDYLVEHHTDRDFSVIASLNTSTINTIRFDIYDLMGPTGPPRFAHRYTKISCIAEASE